MMNKKENLIKALHGSLKPLSELPEQIVQETIYDENGYVDVDFMTAIIEFMAESTSVSLRVQKSLNKLLGIEEMDKNKENKDSGTKWNVEDILKHCTLENRVLKLPNVQFNKKSYSEAKKWIEEAGGKWEGGKIQGFTFPFNPERVFSILHEGKRCNLQQEFQFFETPDELADWIVMLAGGVSPNDRVLEPSAGRGALIRAIHRSCQGVVVDCYELMPENKEFLLKMDNVRILGNDFMESSGCYDKIIANPPFSKNQDIEHVRAMYERLSDGGILAAITSAHWEFSSEKKCVNFREWLNSVDGKSFDISEGEFKDSGTNIKTKAILITKHG